MAKVTCLDMDGKKLKYLYQWDTNQKITITGLDAEGKISIQYSKQSMSGSFVVTPVWNEDGSLTADVPNEMTMTPEAIRAYVYKMADTTDQEHPVKGRTIHYIHIPIMARNKPEQCPCDTMGGSVASYCQYE